MDTLRVNGNLDGAKPSRRSRSFQPPDERDFEKQFKEIRELLNCTGSKTILYKVRGEDIVMFIGNTKSGKSTLVNYALGNELKAIRKKIIPFSMSIEKVNANEEGPIIGLESVSETTLPTVWCGTKSGIREKVVDAPGFEDNRGEAQDIANAFYTKEIIRNAKSVKFVFITDINNIISDNICAFTNFIDKIHNIFPETRALHGGISIVFSKGKEDYSASDICNFLKTTILSQDKMVVSGKSLIQYFVDHEECITFFKMPSSEGPICAIGAAAAILDVIENVITGISRNELANVQPGVSDKSRVFLLQMQAQFCNMSDYLRILEKVKDGFAGKIVKIYEMESIEEVSKMDGTLSSWDKNVNELVPHAGTDLNLSNLLPRIIGLGKVCGIENLTDCNNIDIKLQFVEFLDDTLGLNNCEVYIEKFNGTIEIIRNEINMARLLAATRLNKLTVEEAEKKQRELKDKHDVEMIKYAEKIARWEAENESKTRDQLMHMGVFDHLAEAGMKIISGVASWFGT